MSRYRKPPKYHNKKVRDLDGNTFDSQKEARRWQDLQWMEAAGLISDLKRQQKFVLIPTQREPGETGPRGGWKQGKVIEKECSYMADFVYTKDGQTVVEDVKGYKDGQAYALFVIKRKLMLYRYRIRVIEV